jgi:predicted DNA-binding protein with PD1-like motif
MDARAFRLLPGSDLKQELQRISTENDLQAAAIITCVGSLSKATIRMAGASAGKDVIRVYEEELEIVSAEGTLSTDGLHVHLALSRTDGSCIGGHLKDGCVIKTTAEVIIGEIPSTRFKRVHDNQTGFPELVVESET